MVVYGRRNDHNTQCCQRPGRVVGTYYELRAPIMITINGSYLAAPTAA